MFCTYILSQQVGLKNKHVLFIYVHLKGGKKEERERKREREKERERERERER
jgi:hypothetical protein